MHKLGRPARILLIDDNRGDAILAERAFRELQPPPEVTTASTGEAALAILKREGEHADAVTPDVVLLDLGLPRMSGLEVLTAIKTDSALQHIPVIVMSAYGAGQNVLKAYQTHANAYLVKPSDLNQYRDTIATVEKFFLGTAALPAMTHD
ncbi:response regulator [Asticcacaulis solisilvae]|uniref:response regulator n=1 Tax=Asticcacaulis solisilvae TaxID=1217274 RepID=UPI003FD70215